MPKAMYIDTVVREYRVLLQDAHADKFLSHVRDFNGHAMLDKTSLVSGDGRLYLLHANDPERGLTEYVRGLLAAIGGKIDAVGVEG